MSQVPDDLTCTVCGEQNLDEDACFNNGDVCVTCCAKAGGCCEECFSPADLALLKNS